MKGVKEFIGKEKMLQDWNRVMISILRAQSGESDFNYRRDSNDRVIGLTAEMVLQFGSPLASKHIKGYEDAIKFAKNEVSELISKDGEFTPKQRMLIDWMSIKNSILRAETGEMKISLHKNKAAANKIVGVTVELSLNFNEPLSSLFTDEEKAKIDASKEKLEKE